MPKGEYIKSLAGALRACKNPLLQVSEQIMKIWSLSVKRYSLSIFCSMLHFNREYLDMRITALQLMAEVY